MVASSSSRSLRQPDRRREGTAVSSVCIRRKDSARKAAESAFSSAEETERAVDIHEVRRARAEFYAKDPEERRCEQREAMAREEVRKVKVEGSRRPERKASTSSRSVRSSHHRRRRRIAPEEEAKSGDYVYKRVEVEREVPTLLRRSAERRAPPVEERRSKFIPNKPKLLRSRELEAPRRSSSQRTTARTGSAKEQRRHSYGGSSSNRADQIPPKHAELVEINASRSSRPKRYLHQNVTVNNAHGSRSVSLREPQTALSRSSLQRSATSSRKVRRLSETMPPIAEETRSQGASPTKRPASVFGSLFGPATRKPSGPEPNVTCLACADDVKVSRAAKLSCGHEMCHDCLKRIFTLSVTDPSHMPPKCCTADHINLKHVERLFDDRFKRRWNRKYQEYTTKNRLYCPAKGCGSWIPPRDIHKDSNSSSSSRKYGKCPRCKTKVCAACNGKWHTSRTCPNDEATLRFAEIAKQQGWQRCFNCSAMVELKEGCNHMTCRCTAEFCMICGVKWKSCDCPWFNYAAVENDRLNHMNIPQARRLPVGVVGGAAAAAANYRPRAYQEELEHRLEQVRHDEALARRLQGLDLAPIGLGGGPNNNFNGVDDFTRRAADLLTRPNDAANQAAARRLVDGFRARQQRRGGLRADNDDPAASVAAGAGATTILVSPPPPPPLPPPPPAHEVPVYPVLPTVMVSPSTTTTRPTQWQRRSALSPTRRVSVRGAADRINGNGLANGNIAHAPNTAAAATAGRRIPSPSKLASTRAASSSNIKSRPVPPFTTTTTTRRGGGVQTRQRRPAMEEEELGGDDDDESADSDADSERNGEEGRPVLIRPAELAGLNRKSTTGRVDAWRRFVGAGAGEGEGV